MEGSRPNSIEKDRFRPSRPADQVSARRETREARDHVDPAAAQPPSRPEPPLDVETDPRFPSGPWRGFFLMAHWPGRHQMELDLTFRQGVMTGEGRDRIGPFLIRGKYNLDDGKCHWSKRYIGKHDVAYQGYNEGKGIWGIWEIPPSWRGGFHIWPTAMGDPTSPHLAEAIETRRSRAGGRTEAEVEVGVGGPSPNRSGPRRMPGKTPVRVWAGDESVVTTRTGRRPARARLGSLSLTVPAPWHTVPFPRLGRPATGRAAPRAGPRS